MVRKLKSPFGVQLRLQQQADVYLPSSSYGATLRLTRSPVSFPLIEVNLHLV